MAPKKDDAGGIELALKAPGLTPATLPLSKLIQVLEAARDLVSAVADELGIKGIEPSLTRIKKGSAVLRLSSAPSSDWTRTTNAVRSAIKARGKGHSGAVRQRIHSLRQFAAGSAGKVVIFPVRHGKAVASEAIEVLEPRLEDSDVTVAVDFYGRVVALNERRPDVEFSITVLRDDGSRCPLSVRDPGLFGDASELFRRAVRVEAECHWDPESGEESEWRLLAIAEWKEGDILETMTQVRDDLASAGVTLDVDAILSDLAD